MRKGSIGSLVLTANTPMEFLGPSESRRALTLVYFAATTINGVINTRKPASATDGFPLPVSQSLGSIIKFEDFGVLLCSSWWVWPSSTGDFIGWIEGLEG